MIFKYLDKLKSQSDLLSQNIILQPGNISDFFSTVPTTLSSSITPAPFFIQGSVPPPSATSPDTDYSLPIITSVVGSLPPLPPDPPPHQAAAVDPLLTQYVVGAPSARGARPAPVDACNFKITLLRGNLHPTAPLPPPVYSQSFLRRLMVKARGREVYSVEMVNSTGANIGFSIRTESHRLTGDVSMFCHVVTPGMLADKDGRLATGDQVLAIGRRRRIKGIIY